MARASVPASSRPARWALASALESAQWAMESAKESATSVPTSVPTSVLAPDLSCVPSPPRLGAP